MLAVLVETQKLLYRDARSLFEYLVPKIDKLYFSVHIRLVALVCILHQTLICALIRAYALLPWIYKWIHWVSCRNILQNVISNWIVLTVPYYECTLLYLRLSIRFLLVVQLTLTLNEPSQQFFYFDVLLVHSTVDITAMTVTKKLNAYALTSLCQHLRTFSYYQNACIGFCDLLLILLQLNLRYVPRLAFDLMNFAHTHTVTIPLKSSVNTTINFKPSKDLVNIDSQMSKWISLPGFFAYVNDSLNGFWHALPGMYLLQYCSWPSPFSKLNNIIPLTALLVTIFQIVLWLCVLTIYATHWQVLQQTQHLL